MRTNLNEEVDDRGWNQIACFHTDKGEAKQGDTDFFNGGMETGRDGEKYKLFDVELGREEVVRRRNRGRYGEQSVRVGPSDLSF